MGWFILVSRDDRQPFMYMDDLVEILDINQPPPPNYYDSFHVLEFNGTKADAENVLLQIKPQIYSAIMDLDTGKWSFNPTNPDKETPAKRVWRPAGSNVKKWYNLVMPFKFYFNFEDLTAEEKQLLIEYDITHQSIQGFINRIGKDLSIDAANMIEETDLKNTLPPELN